MTIEGPAQRHYDEHLGPVYGWMLGDPGAARDRARQPFVDLGVQTGASAVAVDLGAGTAMRLDGESLERGMVTLAWRRES